MAARALLRTNVNRDAATLEEWERYPAANNKSGSHVAKGNFGYKENWWSLLDDTTIFGMVGNPSWQADSYREAVHYAASWTPRLLLWNRELMQALEQRAGKRGRRRRRRRRRRNFPICASSSRRSAGPSAMRTPRNCVGCVPIVATWNG